MHRTPLVLFVGLLYAAIALGLQVGERAPDFKIDSLVDGETYHLEAVLKAHEATIVLFIGTKCPYSNAYNERFNRLARKLDKKYPGKVRLIAINSNVDEPKSIVLTHAKEHGFIFPVLKDEKATVAEAYAAEKTPEAFLLNKDGKLIYRGRVDNDAEGKNVSREDLFEALRDYLSKKPVQVQETKAFGCSIKRK